MLVKKAVFHVSGVVLALLGPCCSLFLMPANAAPNTDSGHRQLL